LSAEPDNPYVGLRPFESADSFYFFGRREQTAELLELLHGSRFLAVVGSSGCGKSSLIRAGLIPALLGGFLVEERDRWRVATAKPGDAPLRNLAGALAAAVGDAGDAAALRQAMTESHVQGVADFLVPRLGDGTNLLLLVDQFEEVFAFRGLEDDVQIADLSPAQRRERAIRRGAAADYVDLLLALAERAAQPVYVVLTLRTDFLGECDLFYGLPEALNRGRYLVPRLDRPQLRQAIEGPALLAGARLAPRLLDGLLNELGDRSDRLPVLQHALQRTWEAWRGDGGGAIDQEHYRAAGTLEEALSRHAEEALREEDLAATARIFQRLTDTDASLRRVRRPATLSQLVAVSGLDRPGVEGILERFRAGGRHFVVLSAGASPEDPRVDLSHESLIRQWDRLRSWVDEERQSRDTFVELVRGARREAAGKAALLRDPELQIALDWRAAAAPTAAWAERYSRREGDFDLAMRYLDRSAEAARAAARHRVRTRNLLIATTAVVLLALSGLTVWALRSRAEARSQEATARQTTDFLVGLFKVSDPGEARGNTITARELLDQGAERIGRELADQPEARARLMNTMGKVYTSLGLYERAMPLLKDALRTRKRLFGDDSLAAAESLNELGELYLAQGRYADAEPLFRRSAAIREESLGSDHPEVAETLNNLSYLYWRQGRYAEAVPLAQRALKIQERALGPNHPEVAASLNSLANLYFFQGKSAEAEPLYRRALAIREKVLGPDHLDVAKSLNNLAILYHGQGRLAEAESLYRRSLAIRERVLAADHPLMAPGLESLGSLYKSEGRYAEGEPLFQRALAIREKALGPDHPLVALTLGNLAVFYQEQGKLTLAEPLFRRSLAIREKALGPDHPEVAWTLNKLADLYQEQGRLAGAEPLYRRALAIRQRALGDDHPDVAETLEGLATLYRLTDREEEAARMEARARAIRARQPAQAPGSGKTVSGGKSRRAGAQ
jgi:tetratricopeptide (TPR) repeat protein